MTCKVLNENTNEWTSDSDLGVNNDKTIECNNHVICFYDLQKNLGRKIKFGYQIDFHTIGPNDGKYISNRLLTFSNVLINKF